MTKKKEDVEEYKELLEDTLKNLQKICESRKNEVNPLLVAVGILLLAAGGVVIIYLPSLDMTKNGQIGLWGALGIFGGIAIAFIGYLLAHKGFVGHWR